MMDLWATVPYYTAYLSRALLAEGVNLTVGSITYYLDAKCFTSRGIQNDPGLLDVVGRFRMPKLPRRVLKLAEAMLNLSALWVRFLFSPPDVVHVQYLPMLRWKVPLDWWFLRFCQRRGAAVVLTVHDLLPHDTAERYRQIFMRLYGVVDGLICHSEHIRMRLMEEFQVPEKKIRVIPHGPFFYDLENSNSSQRALEDASGKLLVLWQGIIFPYKGIDLLLDAWQLVEAAAPDALLVIAGTGAPELLDAIRCQVERLGLKQVRLRFQFISTEELVALYRAADVVVYPYRAITTSGALATGLALGRCIVASDLPVFRELLTNGENALLVDPQNRECLSSALIRLLGDSGLRERLQSNTKNMNFGDESWRSIAKSTLEAYADFAT
ncbi:MAG: glycosyltransferase family 4 protein [Acidobacteriaceae bacterium]|nr:glycosyltransferase family 4 protein [Acidobacteriaceae bacterium]